MLHCLEGKGGNFDIVFFFSVSDYISIFSRAFLVAFMYLLCWRRFRIDSCNTLIAYTFAATFQATNSAMYGTTKLAKGDKLPR